MLFNLRCVVRIPLKDQKMELILFAIGSIYRETGTASKDVEIKNLLPAQ